MHKTVYVVGVVLDLYESDILSFAHPTATCWSPKGNSAWKLELFHISTSTDKKTKMGDLNRKPMIELN